MRVLVAGGHGFIGRAAAAALAARHDVVCAGRADLEAAARERFDALVWAAGGRLPTLEECLEVHARAPARIARATGAARIVYLSSGEVYGAQAVPFCEDAAPAPSSPYAQAKLAGEAACAEVAPTVALRLAVVYGPGQRGAMLVPALLAALAARRRFEMTAGEQTRDLVHVDDVARAIALALAGPPGVYNIATGVESRVLDVARHLVAAASRLAGADLAPLLAAGALPYRPAEQMRYALDPSRARAALGWSPTIPLDRGLDATVAAML